ncbi:histidine kinase [Candidatus Leptofilum sp.]|uniref:histidine kinase n=1 Tax=Candidatus Leptofilum sp. TaxID=3241576 RepID=UPI003B5A0B44
MEPPARLSPTINLRQQTAVYRTIWFVVATAVVTLVVVATPLRYRMLQSDVYNFGTGLATLGLSLDFFAAYFVSLELVVVAGSLLVAGLIVWKRANDWFPMLVALSLTLLGLVPPLIDGLHFANPQWAAPVSTLRVMIQTILMAIFCLYPNGRFQPKWTRWLLILWGIFALGILLTQPLMLADTAVLPNTRTWQDAIWLLTGVGWYSVAIWGQVIRYRRHASVLEKQQMKWVLLGFAVLVLFTIVVVVLLISNPNINNSAVNRVRFTLILGGPYLLLALALPAAITLSLLRFRLWDVDILLNRTLVYGGLTGLITAVYILLVSGVGALASGAQSRLAAFVVATALVLLGIRPFHQWLQGWVNRLFPSPSQTNLASVKQHNVRANLLHVAWGINTLLALVLFGAGLTAQIQHSFWQPPALPADAIPLLAGGLTHNSFVQNRGLYGYILIPAYMQAAVFVVVGLFLFWRKSGSVMGILASWMLISIGLGFTPTIFFLPLLNPAWHLPTSLFQASLFGSAFLFLCLFPNGRFYPHLSRTVAVTWLGYTLLWLPFPQLNLHRATTIWSPLLFASMVFLGIAFQLLRYRRVATPEEKQQTKWVIAGFVAANLGLFGIVVLMGFSLMQTAVYLGLAMVLLGMASILIPLTIGFALLRYRLWEIDVIINRTLVYGGLSLGIVAVYVLVVGALGTLFQAQGNVFFALLATGLIAVLFQPVRERLQHAANRLMFGERDDPYRVLSKLGNQLQTNATPKTMLESVVGTIATTLKLPYVAIELDSEQGRLPSASTGKAVAETAEFPLRYQNETVGYLVVSPRSPGEPFSQRERQLLTDIAGQTGAAAYSVRLTTALQRAREKLVLTREEERRRIRRDLHDELGPTLASQTFALDAAIDLLETDPAAAAKLLQSLKMQNQATVANIRQLVYQLRPPSLDELGLLGALQAHFGQLSSGSLPTFTLTAKPPQLPPLSAAVEVAAYRIALEAINNVVRHANATRCDLSLKIVEAPTRMLQLIVTDNGIGLATVPATGIGQQSMRERAEELGGQLTIVNLAHGMQVTAVLPLSQPNKAASP